MKLAKFIFGLLNLAALILLFSARFPDALPFLAPLAKLQLIPAILSLDLVALVVLAALTLLFGRVYCEVLCPLGVAQDVVRLARWNRTRRVCSRLPVSRAQWCVRLALLLLFVVGGVCGLHFVWLDPYAIFGRAAGLAAQPNPDTVLTVASLAIPVLVAVLALVGKGRLWCNWICPAGTLLHICSLKSWKRQVYAKCDHCDNCKLCLKQKEKTDAAQ